MASTAGAISSLYSPRAAEAPGPRSQSGTPPPDEAGTIRVSFDQGLPDPEHFPVAALRQCLVDVLDEAGAAALTYFGEGGAHEMQYGHLGLREQLASWIGRRDGRRPDAAGVTLTNGSTDGLALAINGFVGPDDGAIVEAATYAHARRFMAAAGATVRTVPLDDDGMDVDALEERLEQLRSDGIRPKLIYTIPTFQSPTGTVMPLHRRERLLEIARRWQVMVLEDNCYYAFAYDGAPPPTLLALDDTGLVLQSDSFSKNVVPGLRVAWLAGAPEAVEAAVRVRQDFAVSQLLCRALERYIERGHLDAHLNELRAVYRRKRDLMADALRAHCAPWVRFQVPTGGFFFWLELARGLDGGRVWQLAAERGVAVRPDDGMVAADESRSFLRLSCVQVADDEIEPAVAALGAALADAAST